MQKSYADQVRLELVTASELVHQLLFRRTLREAFFPKVIMDVADLQAALAQTRHLTVDELGALSADNVAQFLDRIRDRDPRFDYEVAFGTAAAPIASVARNGLIVSLSDEEKTINVFARDVEALRRNPHEGIIHWCAGQQAGQD
ncbi:MAG: hypothetical protein ABSC08_17530 [Bryobacteraceae bacterium]